MGTAKETSTRRKRANRKTPGKRQATYVCAICRHRRPNPQDQAECDECGRRICPNCISQARRCHVCDQVVCKACEAATFTFTCPSCGLGHHRDCAIKIACSRCDEFACERCTDGGQFELCESCDNACICPSCAAYTIGDETHEPGACPECDIFWPAAERIQEWKKTRKITEEGVKAAVVMWNKDIDQRAFRSSSFCYDAPERDDALRLLRKASRSRVAIRKLLLEYLDSLVPRVAAELGAIIEKAGWPPRGPGESVFAHYARRAKARRARAARVRRGTSKGPLAGAEAEGSRSSGTIGR